jgi:hypothetical protein
MKDMKASVRYLGFRAVSGGGRQLDFSFSGADAAQRSISVNIASTLLLGPDRMNVQDCAAICFEMLKTRLEDLPDRTPASINLTPADIAQHRKPARSGGRH